MGPGRLGRRPEQHLLRLVPRGLRARPVRGVDRAGRGRRPGHGPRRDAVPVRAPAAARRLDAAQQPRQRQDRAGLVRDPARRGRLPDPDGPPARTDRRDAVREPHQARRELPRRPRAGVRASSAGRSRAATRRRRSPPRSPGWSPRPTWPTPTAIRRRPRSGAASPTTCSGRSRAGRSRPTARCPRTRTSSGCRRPAIRTRPSRYNVGNGGPTLDQRAVIDAGFLELVRLGELPANDPDVARSLRVVDATIKSTTPSGPGWHRYNGDGYGDRASDGRPWAPSGQGTGHLWPVLSAERAEQPLACRRPRRAPRSLLAGMRSSPRASGSSPSRTGSCPTSPASPYGTDPTVASIGFTNGKAAGSASPLTWSAASFVRLTADLAAKRNVALPAVPRSALRHPHAGHHDADRHEPGRQRLGVRLAGHGHRHDRARQHGLRARRPTPTRTPRRPSSRRRPRRTARSASTSRSPAARASSTSSPSARPAGRRTSQRTDRVRLRARHVAPRRRPTRTTTTTARATTPTRHRRLPCRRLRHPGLPGLRRRHATSSSGSGRAT